MQAEFAKIRRQVSFEQIIELLKLIKEHPELYRASARPNLARVMRGFWNTCAETLNNIKGGAFKDAYGWSQYWRYWKFRIKQRTIEITSDKPRTKVPEDDYVPLALVDKIILRLIQDTDDEEEEEGDNGPNPKGKAAEKSDAVGKDTASTSTNNSETARVCGRKRRYSAADTDDVDHADLAPLDTRHRYLGEPSSGSTSDRTRASPIRKRRHAFVNASNAIEQYFKSKPQKKNTEAVKRARGRKRRLSSTDTEDSEDTNSDSTQAAAICHRRHTFTNMNVAIEEDRKNKLLEEQITEENDDPEELELKEAEKIENMTLIFDSIYRVAMDSIRMVAIMNTAKEILNNNPALQQTMYASPTIF